MSVNTLTFQQSSAVLNSLVRQATGRSAVISTEADFISVAQTALTLGKDVIFNELSNVLAKTIFAIRPYSASMKGLEKDLPQWGAYMRKFNIVASDWKDDDAYDYIAGMAKNDLRYAYNLLEVAYYSTNKKITLESLFAHS